MPSKKPTILVRTNETTKSKLEKLARKENRSLSNYIDIILTKHINEYETSHGTISQTVVNNGTMEIGIQNNEK